MSRLRSAPAAKTKTAARSAPAGARGVYVQAPKSDIFVALLGVSLGAILLGCLFLGLVMNRYLWKTKPTAELDAPAASSRTLLAANSEIPKISDTVRL